MEWWNNFVVACKVFFKAFKNIQNAKIFLEPEEIQTRASQAPSHLRLLAILQHEGRLVDFLKEEISSFTDAQIGAAVRKIHQDCGKTLEEYVTLRPLLQETEGAQMTVPQGYNIHAIKLVGKVKGPPPYQGIVRHKGWKAHKLSLPKLVASTDYSVVYPAEIEIL